jgi:hypothetical protein
MHEEGRSGTDRVKLNVWITLFLGGIIYRNLVFQVGEVSKIETINYGHQSRGHERLRWRGSATIENYRPDLSSERAPHVCKPVKKF